MQMQPLLTAQGELPVVPFTTANSCTAASRLALWIPTASDCRDGFAVNDRYHLYLCSDLQWMSIAHVCMVLLAENRACWSSLAPSSVVHGIYGTQSSLGCVALRRMVNTGAPVAGRVSDAAKLTGKGLRFACCS